MVSSWHRGPTSRATSGRKVTHIQYPDQEKVVTQIVPAIEDGESARDALLRLFKVGHNNQFAHNVFKDPRVESAMKKRALKLNLKLSSYYHKAIEEQRGMQ